MDPKEDRDLESILQEQAEKDQVDELDFDRFMVGVVEEQSKKNGKLVTEDETPIRKLNRRYRETAANRTRFSR